MQCNNVMAPVTLDEEACYTGLSQYHGVIGIEVTHIISKEMGCKYGTKDPDSR